MPPRKVVLVVRTTPDYIEWIRQRLPGKVLFLTDPESRQKAAEPEPEPAEEILMDSVDFNKVMKAVRCHLETHCLILSGITCFDCEAMAVTAAMARYFSLPFSLPESVAACQSKLLSKKAWRRHKVPTPEAEKIENEAHLMAFFKGIDGPLVLKPENGTGSELVFLCRTPQECRRQFRVILEKAGRGERFLPGEPAEAGVPGIVAEAFIDGEEYSCDFIVRHGRIQVVRVCRKNSA